MQIDQLGGEYDEQSKNEQKASCIDGEMALPCHCWRLWFLAQFVKIDF
jgi:hypothetical protein